MMHCYKGKIESVILYDIETADFGFLHHVGDTGRGQWRVEKGAREYLKNRIIDLIIGEQVPEQEIRNHGTELIKVLGRDGERLAQEITLCDAKNNRGKKAILNAIENLYGMYGESLNEPFIVKFLKDTLDVETLPLSGCDRESFGEIREKLNDKEPWDQLRLYVKEYKKGKKYFYNALRDFEGLGDVRRFFLFNDGNNNKFFEVVFVNHDFPISDSGNPDEYIDLVFKLFGEDEVLPGDLNQVIYFLRSRDKINTPSADTHSQFKEKYNELGELFSLLANRSETIENE